MSCRNKCSTASLFVALQHATLTVCFKTAQAFQAFVVSTTSAPSTRYHSSSDRATTAAISDHASDSLVLSRGLHLLLAFLCTLRGRLVPENHDLKKGRPVRQRKTAQAELSRSISVGVDVHKDVLALSRRLLEEGLGQLVLVGKDRGCQVGIQRASSCYGSSTRRMIALRSGLAP